MRPECSSGIVVCTRTIKMTNFGNFIAISHYEARMLKWNRFENWRYLQFPNDFLRQHVDFVHFHEMEFVGFVEIIKFEN